MRANRKRPVADAHLPYPTLSWKNCMHKIRQNEERLQAGTSWSNFNLIFCNRKGHHIQPTTLNQGLTRLLKRAGLPHMHVHYLRHSLASILLAMGVHPKVVQEILGHSSVSITMNIYSHVMPTMHSAAAQDLNARFKAVDHNRNVM